MNVATFTGRIGRDAETRDAGKSQVTSWSIAVDVGFGEQKHTLWIDCSLWGDRGPKLAPYLTKGSMVSVSGEVDLRSYEGKNGTQTTLALRVDRVTLCGGKSEARQERAPARQAAPADSGSGGGGFVDDDIPFAPRHYREG